MINEIRPWWAQVSFQADLRASAAEARPVTIRNVKNTRSSLPSSFPLPPSLFPFSSFFSSWPPKTLHFLGKNTKIVIMMSIFDPTRGSYSLGRVLLRRNTLYFIKLCAVHGQSLLDCETKMWSQSEGQMKDLDVNTAIWGIFMSITLQAAVHLGKDYTENLRSTKNQALKSLKQLFQVTERLTTDQREITGLTTIDWQQTMWRETTLLTDRAVQLTTAKTYVFSDSVWCQDDSVNCSCSAKTQKTNWTQGLFDPRGCTSQDEYCTTELFLSVDKLRKNKNKQERRQQQGRDCVSVQMSMSL